VPARKNRAVRTDMPEPVRMRDEAMRSSPLRAWNLLDSHTRHTAPRTRRFPGTGHSNLGTFP
jgi:hypothetical protein